VSIKFSIKTDEKRRKNHQLATGRLSAANWPLKKTGMIKGKQRSLPLN